jgi:hypothetical protein
MAPGPRDDQKNATSTRPQPYLNPLLLPAAYSRCVLEHREQLCEEGVAAP